MPCLRLNWTIVLLAVIGFSLSDSTLNFLGPYRSSKEANGSVMKPWPLCSHLLRQCADGATPKDFPSIRATIDSVVTLRENTKNFSFSLVDEIAALKELSSSKASTDDEVKAYKTRIDELSNQVFDLNLKDWRQEEQAENLKQKLDKLQAEMEQQIKLNKSLEVDLAHYKESTSQLSTALDQQKSEVNRLREKVLPENSELSETLSKLCGSDSELQNKILYLQTVLNDPQRLTGEEIAWMRDRSRDDDLERVSALEEKNATLSEQLNEAVETVAELQEKISCFEQAMKDLSEVHEKEMSSMRDRLSKEHQQERNALEEKCRENARLSEQLAEAEENITRLVKESYRTATEDDHQKRLIEEHRREASVMEAACREIRRDYEDAVEKVTVLTKEKAALEGLLEQLQHELQDRRNLDVDEVANVSTPSSDGRSHDYVYDAYDEPIVVDTKEPTVVHEERENTSSSTNSTDQYCDFCSEFGHDTFSCSNFVARRPELRRRD
ncbi:hypothetical protein Q1695_015479 [Nippostrongylus brasiliensis]|nr:hypothetical protein Q1695_015479 [Nippostrongylus brasiliensis]